MSKTPRAMGVGILLVLNTFFFFMLSINHIIPELKIYKTGEIFFLLIAIFWCVLTICAVFLALQTATTVKTIYKEVTEKGEPA